MPKLSEMTLSKTHRVLVFGGPKVGKTELVAELSSNFDLVWFDLENGWETMLKLPKKQQERIDLIQIPDTKVFPIAIETCLKIITGARVEICHKHGKVACQLCKKDNLSFSVVELNALPPTSIAVFDSLTQLSNSAMNHLTKTMDDTYKPEWSDYRNQGQLLDKFLSQVQQARYNVVCITHEAEVEFDDGRKKLVPVCGTTNFSRNTAKYFDHIVYAEVRNKKHNFASATTYANNILTGSRTDVAIEKKEKASLLDIFLYQNMPSTDKLQATAAKTVLNNLSKGV